MLVQRPWYAVVESCDAVARVQAVVHRDGGGIGGPLGVAEQLDVETAAPKF
jgi:hypothetical protein